MNIFFFFFLLNLYSSYTVAAQAHDASCMQSAQEAEVPVSDTKLSKEQEEERKRYLDNITYTDRRLERAINRRINLFGITSMQNEGYNHSAFASRDKLPLADLKKLEASFSQMYKDYIGRNESCSICTEIYNPAHRIAAICKKHNICFACFSNPLSKACPLCKDKYPFSKLAACYGCYRPNLLSFHHCIACKSIGITCADCLTCVVCDSPRNAQEESNRSQVTEYVRNYVTVKEQMKRECLKEAEENKSAALVRLREEFSVLSASWRQNNLQLLESFRLEAIKQLGVRAQQVESDIVTEHEQTEQQVNAVFIAESDRANSMLTQYLLEHKDNKQSGVNT